MSQLSPFWVTNHQSNCDQPEAPPISKARGAFMMILGSVGLVALVIFGLFYC